MNRRMLAFAALLAACMAVGAVYVAGAARRAALRDGAPAVAANASAGASALPADQPRLLTFSKVNDGRLNRMQVSPLQPEASVQLLGALRCERGHVASGAARIGICLTRTFDNALRAVVSVTVYGPDFEPLMAFPEEGIPSRARMSKDGRLAAYTVFVTGHSYTDVRLSTRTVILDVARRREIGNLETFTVLRAGAPISAPDFNFWGVTFADDGDTFYATLRTAGVNQLVRGTLAGRTVTILRDSVECPSLSPDGTRLAYKSLNPDGQTWRVHVLDLATLADWPISEVRNVDDQVEWLDGAHLVYEVIEGDAYPRFNLISAPADGSGAPSLFLADAASPSVLR